MSFEDQINQITDVAFDVFAVPAIYNGQHSARVILDRDVQRQNNFGELSVNKFEITASRREIENMNKGDTFDIGFDRYTIAMIVGGDADLVIGSAGKNAA